MDPVLNNALQEHVFNNMPIRLLKLPEMELIERGDILEYLNDKLAMMTGEKVNEMTYDLVVDNWSPGFELSDIWKNARERVVSNMVGKHTGYAILSHTWLQPRSGNREVTFRDAVASKETWSSIKEAQGVGYTKLASFCKAAWEKHGMEFAWMDTICINKDSTSELEESIRSMYRWYMNSSICIVHLSQTTSLVDISNDRWFKRGWTLQELLAPHKVEFYNCRWESLAAYNRSEPGSVYKLQNLSLLSKIEEATGIDRVHLWRFSPGIQRTGVAMIMIWAAKRETTRGEDHAYSLMGIFGVNFSIAYGEGKERAFFRLIEAILSSFYSSLSVLNCARRPVSNSIHISSILPSGPECYEGRSDLLSTMSINIPHTPITLTHIGLHVPLLMIHAIPVGYRRRNADDPLILKLEQPEDHFLWSKETEIKIELYNEPETQTNRRNSTISPQNIASHDFYKHYVFGIWNFRDRMNRVDIPQYCAAFLLLIDLEDRVFSMDKVTSDTISPRSKVATKDVIVLESTLSRKEYSKSAEKNDLGMYGVKYLTVYL